MKFSTLSPVIILISLISLTSCGVLEVVDTACIEIKKSSEDKRDIGRTILDMADSGRVGDGMTVEQAQSEGFRYIIEGTEIVIDNPQCFSDQEIETANSLLGR